MAKQQGRLDFFFSVKPKEPSAKPKAGSKGKDTGKGKGATKRKVSVVSRFDYTIKVTVVQGDDKEESGSKSKKAKTKK